MLGVLVCVLFGKESLKETFGVGLLVDESDGLFFSLKTMSA